MSEFAPQTLQQVKRWLRWAGGAAAVALAIAGCGGGGDAVAPTAAVPAQSAPPADIVSQAAVQQAVDQRMALPRLGALASVKSGAASDDFENGMADWSNWGNTQAVAGAGTSGSSAMRVGTGAGGAGLTVPGIVAGTTYRLTAQVRVGNAAERVDVGINFLDASGNKITGSGGSASRGLATPDGWVPVTVEIPAPANAAYAVAWVWKNAGTDYGYVDDVVFAPASAAPPPASGNMIADGGFENGMSAWSNWGNAQVVAGAGTAGSKAMQVGTGAGGAGLTLSGIVPGTKYRLTAQVRVTDPADPVAIGFDLRTASGGFVIGTRSPLVTSTGYTTVTVDFVAPEGSASAVVWVWKNAGSGYAYVDDMAFGPGDAPPPPTAPPATNLVTNGSFESGMAGWVNWGNASVVSGQASSGSSALAVGTAAGGAGQDIGGIVPGTIYRLVVQAKVSDPSETVLVGMRFTDDWGNLQQQSSGRIVSSTSYTAVAMDTTAPPNATRATVYVWKNAGSGFAYVDDYVFGVAPDSAPPPQAPPPSGNLVANGGFENGMASWVDWGNATATGGQAAAGSYAAQVGTGAGGFGQDVAGIVAGNTYRLSGSVKVGSAGETGYLGVKFMNNAGNALLERSVQFTSTAYSTAQVDLTAPANATRALVYVWKNAGSGFAYVDEVALAPVLQRVTLDTSRGQVNPAESGRRYSSPAIARLTTGGHVLAWASLAATSEVSTMTYCFHRYDASGASAAPAACVAGARPGAAGPSVVARPGGAFTIVWNEAPDSTDTSGLHWQDYDAAGTAQGAIQSGPLPIWLSAKPLAGGGYVKLLPAREAAPASFQLYAADGTPVGGPRPVSDAAEYAGGVVGLSGGGFAVAWMQHDASGTLVAMTRAFSADGVAAGDPLAIAPNTMGPVSCAKGTAICPPFQYAYGIVASADGGYIVVWGDGTGEGSSGGSFARQFRADGSAASTVVGRLGDLTGPLVAAGPDEFWMAIVDSDPAGVSALHVNAVPLR